MDETPGLAVTNQQGHYESTEAFLVAEMDTPASAVLHVANVLHCGLESCNGPWPGPPFFETLTFKVQR